MIITINTPQFVRCISFPHNSSSSSSVRHLTSSSHSLRLSLVGPPQGRACRPWRCEVQTIIAGSRLIIPLLFILSLSVSSLPRPTPQRTFPPPSHPPDGPPAFLPRGEGVTAER